MRHSSGGGIEFVRSQRAGGRAVAVIYDCKSRIGARGRRHRYRYYYCLRGGLLYGSVLHLLALVV